PEAAKAAFVSASFFEALGVQPQLGRVFTPGEEDSRQPVAVLSEPLWRRISCCSDALDRAVIRINGLTFRIIGVMPSSFAWPWRDSVVWVPITQNREWVHRAGPVPFFRVVGRLAPGVTRTEAEAELQSMHAREAGTVRAVPVRPPLAGNL